jgi:hypothetical protein
MENMRMHLEGMWVAFGVAAAFIAYFVTRVRLLAYIVASLVLVVPIQANAHHLVSEYGIAWTEPVSVLELDLQVAEFQLGDRSGHWVLAALAIEYAFHERFSASLWLPFAWIEYATGSRAVGIGDIELAGKVLIFATPHGEFILSAGAGLELPTGNADNGLGSGHFELSPYVSASSAPANNFVIYGLVSERISFGDANGGGHEHPEEGDGHEHSGVDAHGSVLSPHADHELFVRLGAAYVIGPVYFSGGSDVVVVWSGSKPLGPVVLRGEFGWLPRERIRLAAGIDVPVAGEKRFSWRARTGVAWMF